MYSKAMVVYVVVVLVVAVMLERVEVEEEEDETDLTIGLNKSPLFQSNQHLVVSPPMPALKEHVAMTVGILESATRTHTGGRDEGERRYIKRLKGQYNKYKVVVR